uniref:Growth factor receptor bound protein 2 n=1 Tax=Echinococcus granulosus TaxID=6210 RepID=A0A068WI26_ECHGR|nr:growth factor receptor bound protein 2 [Echinococcus granulosus]
MEADAKHDFQASAADELPFCKNSILSVEDDPNWYLAEQDGRKGLVPCNYISFRPNPWYMQACRRNTAEECLLETDPYTGLPVQPDGAFVVRRSESNGPGFSLSVKDGQKVQHFKVLQDEMGKYFVWLRKFDSINQLIDYHRRTSISRDGFLLLVDRQPSRMISMGRGDQQSQMVQRVIARFDFNASEPEELSFHRGDVIEVLGQEDENWWRGRISNTGSTGLFPANYVDTLPPIMPNAAHRPTN